MEDFCKTILTSVKLDDTYWNPTFLQNQTILFFRDDELASFKQIYLGKLPEVLYM